MKLLFEYPDHGKTLSILPKLDTPETEIPAGIRRQDPLRLPNISENELSRHFAELESQTFGVCDGFYPLGSCTMKYNPKINDEMASLQGFTDIHPLQPVSTVQGALEMMYTLERSLCEITGMDDITLQPAAGAHGEFTGILLIKAYHEKNGDTDRTEIIVPVSAHGTNPATAAMAGYKAVNAPVRDDGCVDLEALKKLVGPKTAGLMLTNPNTVGLFEKDILEISKLIHDAGGLLYYDGANLNPVMGIVRPGDMGFDVVHLNLHKTFSTPHGGGGPGSGPVGCKKLLSEFLPVPRIVEKDGSYDFDFDEEYSIGKVRSFYGNFLVNVKALSYILTLGAEGIRQAAEGSVINANYMRKSLEDLYDMAYPDICMHEFVMTLERQKKEKGVSAMDFAKTMLDYRMHPPTMYFPLCVKEALMVEPTETESKQSLDEAIAVYRKIYEDVMADPEYAAKAPHKTPITRVDEVGAARNPRLRFEF
jgi:glycine dehydrogenase subunit 2